jgi:hypothetical protein
MVDLITEGMPWRLRFISENAIANVAFRRVVYRSEPAGNIVSGSRQIRLDPVLAILAVSWIVALTYGVMEFFIRR